MFNCTENNLPLKLSDDDWLKPYQPFLQKRFAAFKKKKEELRAYPPDWHEIFGLHRLARSWVFREWLPNATNVWLTGTFNNWSRNDDCRLQPIGDGVWEGVFHGDMLHHLDCYGLFVQWNGGEGFRLPSAATRVVRHQSGLSQYGVAFNAQVWDPPASYVWKNTSPRAVSPLIYETHVGMAQEKDAIGTFREFKELTLPRIADAGYNTVQLMAVQEHPFYGSFGYHVSNFFSVCDLFGTPDELKELIDAAHGLGLRVIMDFVQSHSVKNEIEGLGYQDGTPYLYFHDGARGWHPAWDSRCFDYAKPQVCRFLLSQCRFWLEEYHLDGFRFDGITSMLYRDHGLYHVFTGYDDYFSDNVDGDAVTYLALANDLIHAIKPDAWTFAEDVSGMPGLAATVEQGGCGFDFRFAMGVPDLWFKLCDTLDEYWNMDHLWYELNNRRQDEKSIAYVECHDQAMVGGQTLIFKLIGADMYYQMQLGSQSMMVDRGIALHKMARLLTIATAGHGYLNFMGNEFGHPEWIDFPRDGNGWSFAHAKRLWSLRDNPGLRYKGLAEFDHAMLTLIRNHPDFYKMKPHLVRIDDQNKIICFMRNGLLFCFNFHPVKSQPEFELQFSEAVTFEPVFDSDNSFYGGFDRIGSDWTVTTETDDDFEEKRYSLKLYLPCRTAIVLRLKYNP